jgi:transcription antitermination factor NusB
MNRREAREQAFLLVFEKTFKNDPLPEIIEAAILARDLEVDEFSNRVAAGVVEHLEEIDSSIEKNIIGWKKNRLSRVVVSVLRVAVYEMLYEKDIPVSVSINEALEIAKKYGSQDDAPYINGVLGAVAKEIGEKA